jgi:hypothetical protein
MTGVVPKTVVVLDDGILVRPKIVVDQHHQLPMRWKWTPMKPSRCCACQDHGHFGLGVSIRTAQ